METVYFLNTKVYGQVFPSFGTLRESMTHMTRIFRTSGISRQWGLVYRKQLERLVLDWLMHPMNSCMILKIRELFDLKPSFTVMFFYILYTPKNDIDTKKDGVEAISTAILGI